MPFKFLIDERLSPDLVDLARTAGHVETTCVRDRGLAGTKDWDLVQFVVAGDFTLVTNNSRDFRGKTPGTPDKLYAKEEIHAGLVCLNIESGRGMDLTRQLDLFQLALTLLASRPDLINKALEVTERSDGSVGYVVYAIPGNGL